MLLALAGERAVDLRLDALGAREDDVVLLLEAGRAVELKLGDPGVAVELLQVGGALGALLLRFEARGRQVVLGAAEVLLHLRGIEADDGVAGLDPAAVGGEPGDAERAL